MLRKAHHKRRHSALGIGLGGRRRRRMHGRGIMDFLKKAHGFIKDNKLVSRVGSLLGSVGVPYAGAIAKGAELAGYGRRRHRRRGGSLRLAGMGLSPAGGWRRHRKRRLY